MRKLLAVVMCVSAFQLYAAAPVVHIEGVPDSSNPSSGDNSQIQADPASFSIEDRVSRLENQMHYFANINNVVQSTQQRITDLQGQIEELQHQLATEQQAESALEQRVAALEKQKTAPVALPAAAPTHADHMAHSSSKSVAAYDRAHQEMLAKKYTDALRDFNDFVRKYPKSDRAGEAHYWLGELYIAEGQPDRATQEFQRAASNPNSVKAPDAMVKLGIIFLANGDSAHAKQMFQKVVSNYPGTVAASNAKEHLKSMSAE